MNEFKIRNRALMCALQADAKDFDGGISALAALMGRNPTTLANQLNPEKLDTSPPSMETLVEIIKLTQARRTIFFVCRLVGMTPLDMALQEKSAKESIRSFLEFVSTVSSTIGKGSEAAQDGRFDALERRDLEIHLHGVMQSASELLQSLSGEWV